MESSFIKNYSKQIQKTWTAENFEILLREMVKDQDLVRWLEILLSLQESKELLRDPESGIVLTAYTETAGRYRAPHDHGSCWVVYAVMAGTIEMRTFKRAGPTGKEVEVLGKNLMEAGDARLYRQGEIHDTRCQSEKVLILRLTSCDLKVEEQDGRMTRFAPTP